MRIPRLGFQYLGFIAVTIDVAMLLRANEKQTDGYNAAAGRLIVVLVDDHRVPVSRSFQWFLQS